MGRAASANPRSLSGHLPSEVEKARLREAPLSELVRVLLRLWWERIRG